MKRVKFTLSMPKVNSWDGRWSGANRNYFLVRNLTNMKFHSLKPSYGYSFGDGWHASVTTELLKPGERSGKSDGFCGYDWMVDSILDHGDIRV